MKPGGKSLLALIGPGKGGGDEDDDAQPPASGPGDKSGDTKEMKIDAMRNFISSVKDGDPESALSSFSDLCELHAKEY